MKKILHILLLCFLMFSTNVFSAEKQVVIAVIEEWSDSLNIIKELLTDSYNEIGYKAVFKDLPPARGLSELSHGKIDGDVIRTKILVQNYDVVLVQPPFFTLKSYAYYSIDQFKKAPSVNDIKNGKVGYIHGAYTVEKFLTNAKLLIKANTQTQLLNLLQRKRVDYIVPSASIPIDDKNLKKVLLFEVPVHHILSSKHKELAKKLEPILRKNMSKKKFSNLEKQVLKGVFIQQRSN